MRRVALAALAMLLAACPGPAVRPAADCPDPGSAAGTVCEFYQAYLRLRPAGLPSAAEQAELASWLSERLERQLDAARAVQAAYRDAHPGEKPPLVDGFLFASLFEGPTDFEVGAAVAESGVWRVPVQFSYGAEVTWQDSALVMKEGGRYVIDDVELAGAGPFNPAGRLSDLLRHAGD